MTANLGHQPSHLTHDADTAPPPAVVCGLSGARHARAAAEFAAWLARVLGWRLVLVPSARANVKPHLLIGTALREGAGVIVRAAGTRGNARDAASLASESGVPVIVVPTRGGHRRGLDGPVVCAVVDSAEAGPTVRIAARFALEAGVSLELVHIARGAPLDDVHTAARKAGAGMVAIDAIDAERLQYRAVKVPVMIVPSEWRGTAG